MALAEDLCGGYAVEAMAQRPRLRFGSPRYCLALGYTNMCEVAEPRTSVLSHAFLEGMPIVHTQCLCTRAWCQEPIRLRFTCTWDPFLRTRKTELRLSDRDSRFLLNFACRRGCSCKQYSGHCCVFASKAKERLREGTLEGRNSAFAVAGLGAAASSHDPPPAMQAGGTGSEPSRPAGAHSVAMGPAAKRSRTLPDEIFPAMLALKLLARDSDRVLLDFELKDILGKGTFGSVFAATIGPRHEVVAIKIFQGSDCRITALREALALERCAHPHIIRLLDAWADGERKRSFLVFPKCASDLEHHIRQAPGSFTVHACRELLESMCKAVAWIHVQGLLRTDLKPGNVLLGNVAPVGNFYVADLGCCVEAMGPSICKQLRRVFVFRVSVRRRAAQGSRTRRRRHVSSLGGRRPRPPDQCHSAHVHSAECLGRPIRRHLTHLRSSTTPFRRHRAHEFSGAQCAGVEGGGCGKRGPAAVPPAVPSAGVGGHGP